MRLHAFRETFPQIIYYNPLWNAGQVAPYSLACGIIQVDWLLWPLWYFGAPKPRLFQPRDGLALMVCESVGEDYKRVDD